MENKKPEQQPASQVAVEEKKEETATKNEKLIIDDPALQKPLIRGAELVFSAGMWVIFIYLLQGLITGIFWIIGGYHVYGYVLAPEVIQGTKDLLFLVAIWGVIVFCVLFLWANWNYWAYGRKERRKSRGLVSVEEAAAYHGISPELAKTAKSARQITIRVEDDNLILNFDKPTCVVNPEVGMQTT